MAKKKDSEALFEIISRSKSPQGQPGITVPEWMKPQPEEPAPGDATPADDVPTDEAPADVEADVEESVDVAHTTEPETVDVPEAPIDETPPEVEPPVEETSAAVAEEPEPEPQPQPEPEERAPEAIPAPRARPMPVAASEKPAAWPLVAVRNGRLEVSLSPLSCGVLAIGLAVMMIGMVLIGKQLTPTENVVAGSDAPKNQDVLGTEGRRELQRRTPEPPPVPKRIGGKYYMMIAGMPGSSTQDQQEAARIAAFCAQAGVPSTVNRVDGQYVVVYSLTPFDRPDSEQAVEYADKIRALGEKYQELHTGSPGFYQKDPHGKWPWFNQHPAPAAEGNSEAE